MYKKILSRLHFDPFDICNAQEIAENFIVEDIVNEIKDSFGSGLYDLPEGFMPFGKSVEELAVYAVKKERKKDRMSKKSVLLPKTSKFSNYKLFFSGLNCVGFQKYNSREVLWLNDDPNFNVTRVINCKLPESFNPLGKSIKEFDKLKIFFDSLREE